MKAFLYGRVSSESQEERQTIDTQKQFLRDYCKLYGHEILGEYRDEAQTGTLDLDKRIEGKKLLDTVKTSKPDCILVYRVDRLARTLAVLLRAYQQLNDLGVAINSETEAYDSSEPTGRFLFQLLGSLSELDRTNLLQKTSDGKRRKVREGIFHGGVIPWGYTLLDGKLVLDPETASITRSIFKSVANGQTLMHECSRLQALGINPTRCYRTTEIHRGDNWPPSRLSYMLNNPLYYGNFEYKSKRTIIKYDIPALVSKDLWL